MTVIYAGNERGDILAIHLSPSELATLCGEETGPVPCQRRANHNPYRHVRVKLTPQTAYISLRAACRAQRQEDAGKQGMGTAGGCDVSRFVASETVCIHRQKPAKLVFVSAFSSGVYPSSQYAVFLALFRPAPMTPTCLFLALGMFYFQYFTIHTPQS